MSERWCGMCVVGCDVCCFLVVVSHRGQFGFDWFVVLVVGVVDGVVVGTVESGEYVH